jgi:hypothetical protein
LTNLLDADRDVRPSQGSRLSLGRSSVLNLARSEDTVPLPISVTAFALLLAVGLVHIQDQGGFIGNVTPLYMAIGYYVVEIGAAITIPFVLRKKTAAWVLSALLSIGPFIAYILSRSVGLPGDPGDVGNWGYLLGTVSLVVEGSLFILSVACLLRAVSAWRRYGQ